MSINNLEPGTIEHNATCTACNAENVTVVYDHTESWGRNPARPVGSVQFWLCSNCNGQVQECQS